MHKTWFDGQDLTEKSKSVESPSGESRGTVEASVSSLPRRLSVDEESACVICLSAPRSTVINPCLHKCLCYNCASELRQQNAVCPLCRSAIAEFWLVEDDQQTSDGK